MIEKDPAYKTFEKKIIPYIDGSLSPQEVSEFEAFVMTHPEFEKIYKSKEQEIILLKKMIPQIQLPRDIKESLESEIRFSVFNLLKEEPKSLFDSLFQKWEEWQGR